MTFRCFSEKYLTSSGMIKTFNSGFMLAEVSEILFHTVNPLSKDLCTGSTDMNWIAF